MEEAATTNLRRAAMIIVLAEREAIRFSECMYLKV